MPTIIENVTWAFFATQALVTNALGWKDSRVRVIQDRQEFRLVEGALEQRQRGADDTFPNNQDSFGPWQPELLSAFDSSVYVASVQVERDLARFVFDVRGDQQDDEWTLPNQELFAHDGNSTVDAMYLLREMVDSVDHALPGHLRNRDDIKRRIAAMVSTQTQTYIKTYFAPLVLEFAEGRSTLRNAWKKSLITSQVANTGMLHFVLDGTVLTAEQSRKFAASTMTHLGMPDKATVEISITRSVRTDLSKDDDIFKETTTIVEKEI